mgnify:FL=1
MKLILTWASILALVFSATAQQDPKAREILDDLSAATKAYTTIKAEFTSKAVNSSSNMDEEYKGKLWQKGEKYKLDFMDAITYFNGEQKWVYMPDVMEVNLFSVNDEMASENIFDNPQEIFTIYEEDFKYLYKGKTTFNGSSALEIELVPEDKDVEYFKIKLYVNESKDEIRGFKYYAKNGTRVTVTIDSFKANLPMNDSMFAFDKSAHPEAELIDMRE